jgi:hypothetical protein
MPLMQWKTSFFIVWSRGLANNRFFCWSRVRSYRRFIPAQGAGQLIGYYFTRLHCHCQWKSDGPPFLSCHINSSENHVVTLTSGLDRGERRKISWSSFALRRRKMYVALRCFMKEGLNWRRDKFESLFYLKVRYIASRWKNIKVFILKT